jgi:hypothetical protein
MKIYPKAAITMAGSIILLIGASLEIKKLFIENFQGEAGG